MRPIMVTTVRWLGTGLITPLFLAACATVTGQSRDSVTVDGQTYAVATTTFRDTGNGTLFAKSVVLVAGMREPCNPTVANDCAAAVRFALRRTGRPSNNPRRLDSDKYILPG